MSATLHLVEGPVGAGKSTFAAGLHRGRQAPRLILDDWMARLFRPDRPAAGVMDWYLERKDRCIEQLWRLADEILVSGSDVVLELGLIRQADRDAFTDRVRECGHPMHVYVLDAPLDVRRERVLTRNQERGDTFAVEVQPEFFELAGTLWEPVDEVEFDGFEVEFIDTDDAAAG